MKTAGIVGGIGPESTIQYYRQIIDVYRDRQRDGSFPSFLLHNVDMHRMIELISADEQMRLVEFLLSAIKRLAAGGADFAAISANAPHIVFDEVRRWSPIELISIVEATSRAAKSQNLKRLGLFGARFTMQGSFYPEVFARDKLTIIVPNESEQALIHEKYFNELGKGIVLPETRAQLLAIAARLRDEEKIDGLILGGTELTLILSDVTDQGIPFLDTAKIHIDAIVAKMFS